MLCRMRKRAGVAGVGMGSVVTLNFTVYAATVAGYPDAALTFALSDIAATLPMADGLDRAQPLAVGSRGGYYRDQASVIRAEVARRARR